MRNIVILISGSGSNMRAIISASKIRHWESRFDARIACVLSNKKDAPGLAFAKESRIPTHVITHQEYTSREAFDQALRDFCATFDQKDVPCLIVLAGFMRILTPVFVNSFEGRLLNIHPSLLPAFQGLNTHQRAIEYGCKFAGVSVHHVTHELDAGRIIDQIVVPILPDDNAASLGERVLTQEYILYPRAIETWLASQQCTKNAAP